MKGIIRILMVLAAAVFAVNALIKDNECKEFSFDNLSKDEIKRTLYGKIEPGSYVRGMFNPSKYGRFVKLKKYGILTNARDHYLRIEAVKALKKMLKAFNKEHPNIEIRVISSTRNFYSQKSIWNAKWKGKRKVDGMSLNRAVKDPLKRAQVILKYSSMPGTSRHHWGTDFDINSLENSYFKKGQGKIIYAWLTKNGSKYGFVQPYTANRKSGYLEERWHWSYVPLAKYYYREWMKLYAGDTSKLRENNPFGGAGAAAHLAPIYVKSINSACH
jgi:LAS superfamily LD-carboxypeptidase LdcB